MVGCWHEVGVGEVIYMHIKEVISYFSLKISYVTLMCYVMLCYVMLCYVMLCYVMLCYVML